MSDKKEKKETKKRNSDKDIKSEEPNKKSKTEPKKVHVVGEADSDLIAKLQKRKKEGEVILQEATEDLAMVRQRLTKEAMLNDAKDPVQQTYHNIVKVVSAAIAFIAKGTKLNAPPPKMWKIPILEHDDCDTDDEVAVTKFFKKQMKHAKCGCTICMSGKPVTHVLALGLNEEVALELEIIQQEQLDEKETPESNLVSLGPVCWSCSERLLALMLFVPVPGVRKTTCGWIDDEQDGSMSFHDINLYTKYYPKHLQELFDPEWKGAHDPSWILPDHGDDEKKGGNQ